MIRELIKRLDKLEQLEDASQAAYVTVIRKDGSETNLVWCDALKEALDGNIASVTAGMMGGLVEAMLTDEGVK